MQICIHREIAQAIGAKTVNVADQDPAAGRILIILPDADPTKKIVNTENCHRKILSSC